MRIMNKSCDVCKEERPDTGVKLSKSSLGGYSFWYCKECGLRDAEPDGMQNEVGFDYITFRGGHYIDELGNIQE